MSESSDDKALLQDYNDERYQAFKLNDDLHLKLIQPSDVPWISASTTNLNKYAKWNSHPVSVPHVSFITKDEKPHAMLWKTHPDTFKRAVRWGIVRAESITGRVISSLGSYRITAHKRVAKGMRSNSQSFKLKLLDLFQERFEALQEIESLVNRYQTMEDYELAFKAYDKKITAISHKIEQNFPQTEWVGFDEGDIARLKSDLEEDKKRASDYLKSLNEPNIATKNRSRGHDSTGEFVKQQMLRGLYELQGINQDISYSNQRFFALTRGKLNDSIEDARKELDEHQTDLSNAVTMEHHGLHSLKANKKLLTYDFSSDNLSPKRERDVLLAISFIEGWDKVESDRVYNDSNNLNSELLDTIAATRWKTHRSLWVTIKSLGFYMLNLVKSFFVTTRPWEEETWNNPDFHLKATELMAHASGNEPLWRKPFYFFKQLAMALVDIVKGIRNIGTDFVFEMPADIAHDWQSSGQLPPLNQTLREVSDVITEIRIKEKARLDALLAKFEKQVPIQRSSTNQLAQVAYALEVGEQNDILSSLARGLNQFGSIFSHNIFAKDPFAGLAFTGAYALGAAAIYFPELTSSVVGASYVKSFSDFGYSMAASKPGAMIAAGSTQGQTAVAILDTIEHGSSGIAAEALAQIGEDPLTIIAYFAAAYATGHVLIHGIHGQDIPWLSEHLRADLGTNPITTTILVGGKCAVGLFELFHSLNSHSLKPKALSFEDHKENIDVKVLNRMILMCWLITNLQTLPKLSSKHISAVSRQISDVFTKEESISLKKILYPEKKRSIAFQLLYIPLSYVPIILRSFLSIILSFFAAVIARPNPLAPMKQAWGRLSEKVKKDLSRLLVFTAHALYVPYMFIATMMKMLAYCILLTISRVAGWCGLKPGHAIHKAFSSLHSFFRHIGEFLYPVSLLKEVSPAHPIHTITEIESSYQRFLSRLGTDILRTSTKENGETSALTPKEDSIEGTTRDNQYLLRF